MDLEVLWKIFAKLLINLRDFPAPLRTVIALLVAMQGPPAGNGLEVVG